MVTMVINRFHIFIIGIILAEHLLAGPAGAGTVEDIRKKTGYTGPVSRHEGERKLFKIQSVIKGTTRNWVFSDGPGVGTVRTIEVKFKINERGNIYVPYLIVYLYDKKRQLVDRLTRYFYRSSIVDDVLRNNGGNFRGKKSHLVKFGYRNTVQFKYYLAVIGSDEEVDVVYKPERSNLSIEDFDFNEKDIYLGQ